MAYDGSKYFLTIVEDLSQCTWTYMLKRKSDAQSCLKTFVALVKTQFAIKIKTIPSDNGLEFHLSDFYATKGIIHQRTYVETPEQNGIVKRKHQHLLWVVRSLRFQSGLILKYWTNCIMIATYLINQIPTPLLSNHSPFETLFKTTPPSYNHLRVFSCLAFASTLS